MYLYSVYLYVKYHFRDRRIYISLYTIYIIRGLLHITCHLSSPLHRYFSDILNYARNSWANLNIHYIYGLAWGLDWPLNYNTRTVLGQMSSDAFLKPSHILLGVHCLFVLCVVQGGSVVVVAHIKNGLSPSHEFLASPSSSSPRENFSKLNSL